MVKSRVGYLPDEVGFYDDMTARQNLRYTAALNRLPGVIVAEHASSESSTMSVSTADADRKVGDVLPRHAPAPRRRRRARQGAVAPDPRRADGQHRPGGRTRAAPARRAAAQRSRRDGPAVVAPAAPGPAGVRPDRHLRRRPTPGLRHDRRARRPTSTTGGCSQVGLADVADPVSVLRSIGPVRSVTRGDGGWVVEPTRTSAPSSTMPSPTPADASPTSAAGPPTSTRSTTATSGATMTTADIAGHHRSNRDVGRFGPRPPLPGRMAHRRREGVHRPRPVDPIPRTRGAPVTGGSGLGALGRRSDPRRRRVGLVDAVDLPLPVHPGPTAGPRVPRVPRDPRPAARDRLRLRRDQRRALAGHPAAPRVAADPPRRDHQRQVRRRSVGDRAGAGQRDGDRRWLRRAPPRSRAELVAT